MEKMVAIVNFGMGNLFSVKHACLHVGLSPVIVDSPKEILQASAVILPGVGAFGEAMQNLKKANLISPLKEVIAMGKPFMGICLGMQLLMTESSEFGYHQGLNVIEGKVISLRESLGTEKGFKVPHVGWNKMEGKADHFGKNLWLADIKSGDYMYFVHSFSVVPKDAKIVLSTTPYGPSRFCSSLQTNNIFACQFHPERSGQKGLKIYFNFARFVLGKEKEEKQHVGAVKKQVGTPRASHSL